MFNRLFIALFLLFAPCSLLLSIEIPREHVFVFERSTNTNYVCYDINLKDGFLCQSEPLKTYWVLGGETRMEGLTFLDRKMAYGIKVIQSEKEEAFICMTAYRNLTIHICKHKGRWVGIVNLHGHKIILQKMFAKMKDSSSVRCEYVEISGTDIVTGERRLERIKP